MLLGPCVRPSAAPRRALRSQECSVSGRAVQFRDVQLHPRPAARSSASASARGSLLRLRASAEKAPQASESAPPNSHHRKRLSPSRASSRRCPRILTGPRYAPRAAGRRRPHRARAAAGRRGAAGGLCEGGKAPGPHKASGCARFSCPRGDASRIGDTYGAIIRAMHFLAASDTPSRPGKLRNWSAV